MTACLWVNDLLFTSVVISGDCFLKEVAKGVAHPTCRMQAHTAACPGPARVYCSVMFYELVVPFGSSYESKPGDTGFEAFSVLRLRQCLGLAGMG